MELQMAACNVRRVHIRVETRKFHLILAYSVAHMSLLLNPRQEVARSKIALVAQASAALAVGFVPNAALDLSNHCKATGPALHAPLTVPRLVKVFR